MITTEENTETEVATEEVKESKLKAFGTKVKRVTETRKEHCKRCSDRTGLVTYAIGSRAGGSDDDSDVVSDSDYVEIDEAESTDETSEKLRFIFSNRGVPITRYSSFLFFNRKERIMPRYIYKVRSWNSTLFLLIFGRERLLLLLRKKARSNLTYQFKKEITVLREHA